MNDQQGLSYHHRGGNEPLLWATIPEHIWKVAVAHPDNLGVVSRHQHRRLSYRELTALAKRMLATGFTKGDRIGVWATDHVEWLLVQLATARIGIILVTINPAYRTRAAENPFDVPSHLFRESIR